MSRGLVIAIWIAMLAAVPARAEGPLFQPIFQVLTHPRCLNCHTKTGFPRQGDERRRHDQLVMSGPADHGVPTLQCSSCHQDRNVADGAVPGAPHWGLAPLSMAWEDLTPTQLCATLKDTSRNGGRDLEALFTHMAQDALVLWGWSPGGSRTTPPLEHPQFVAALRAWIDGGAPCD